jgi:hypothetical protein
MLWTAICLLGVPSRLKGKKLFAKIYFHTRFGYLRLLYVLYCLEEYLSILASEDD